MVGGIVGPSHPIIATGLSHNFHLATCRVTVNRENRSVSIKIVSCNIVLLLPPLFRYIELNAQKYPRVSWQFRQFPTCAKFRNQLPSQVQSRKYFVIRSRRDYDSFETSLENPFIFSISFRYIFYGAHGTSPAKIERIRR